MVSSLGEALHPLNDKPVAITTAPGGPTPPIILHTNKAWSELTGYKFVEVVHRTNFSFMQGPDTQAELVHELREAVRKGTYVRVKQLVNYTKSGDPFYNTIECNPLKDGSGKVTHWCAVLSAGPAASLRRMPLDWAPPVRQLEPLSVDETPPQLGELGAERLPSALPVARTSSAAPLLGGGSAAILPEATKGAAASPHRPKRQKRHLQTGEVLSNQVDPIVMTQAHPPYAITHVNQPWCEMCGYSAEEVEGFTNAILSGPETDKELVGDLMSSLRRGEPASATLVNYKKGGVRFLNQVQMHPVYNEDDELEQFMAMLHEV